MADGRNRIGTGPPSGRGTAGGRARERVAGQVLRRVHVTGNAGAGKTTLALRLGGVLGLPVTSLDSIVWQPGWRKTPPDERRVREEQAIRAPSWIIEGVSARVRAAADLVIFLDVPRVVCVRRSLTRGLRHLGRTRPDLPPGCPEWRIVLRLLGIIRRFPDLVGREIRREAAAEPDRYRIVTWAGSGEGVPARGPRRYRSRR